MRLSVVVPALDEAARIGPVLRALLALEGSPEIVVVDGGSRDGTVAAARAFDGVRVIASERGRGAQLHAGALAAHGDVLWFVHADTLAPPDAPRHIAAALADPRTVGGNFGIRFEGPSRAARVLTRIYARLWLLGLRYGDSAYFVRREDYLAAGGFRPLPIFEDLDLLRRLRRRGRFVRVPAEVVTSSRRFEGRSFALVFLHWTMLQVLFWLGVPAERLGSWYRDERGPAPRA